jgi:hypothetical protein
MEPCGQYDPRSFEVFGTATLCDPLASAPNWRRERRSVSESGHRSGSPTTEAALIRTQ